MRRVVLAFGLLLSAAPAAAADCLFDVTGMIMRLTADCSTDASIAIPDGFTLDGGDHTITAIDPPGGHFVGGVVTNAGARASVVRTRITASSLLDVCDAGAARLSGVLFDGASGEIRGNSVVDLTQGASTCQEGNGIEVRNFGGGTITVEIADNVVEAYQKTGIVAHGDVDVWIHHNRIGASATQAHLVANAVQIGFRAWANVEENEITGNSWPGFPSADAAATAVLVFRAAAGTVVRQNTIGGNADIAIYVLADGVTVDNNRLSDEGPDLGGYDIGVGNYGAGNRVTGNKISGYDTPHEGETGGGDALAPGDLRIE